MSITINHEQRLFVKTNAEYLSVIGFDVVFDHCRELAKRIESMELVPSNQSLPEIKPEAIGTNEQYEQYQFLLSIARGHKLGTWFNFNTPNKVRKVLETYRKNDSRIRLFYGDKETGRSWLEENDVVGKVGRSVGFLQIPLLLCEGENHGGAILDSCVVKIIDADTQSELYRHPHFHLPEMEIRETDENLKKKGYTHAVWVKQVNGKFENHANFKSLATCAHWIAFISGQCSNQPV